MNSKERFSLAKAFAEFQRDVWPIFKEQIERRTYALMKEASMKNREQIEDAIATIEIGVDSEGFGKEMSRYRRKP